KNVLTENMLAYFYRTVALSCNACNGVSSTRHRIQTCSKSSRKEKQLDLILRDVIGFVYTVCGAFLPISDQKLHTLLAFQFLACYTICNQIIQKNRSIHLLFYKLVYISLYGWKYTEFELSNSSL
ncbi:hypothetical protein HPP92_027333, partial [Vanilla planifolia]